MAEIKLKNFGNKDRHLKSVDLKLHKHNIKCKKKTGKLYNTKLYNIYNNFVGMCSKYTVKSMYFIVFLRSPHKKIEVNKLKDDTYN